MHRIYPLRRDRLGVSLSAQGADLMAKSLTAWKMAPSNPWWGGHDADHD